MTTSELGPSSAWGPGAPAGAGSGPGAPASEKKDHHEAMMTSHRNKKNPPNQNAYGNGERFGRGRGAPRVDREGSPSKEGSSRIITCGPMLPGAGSGPAHARAVFARLGRNMNPKSQTLLKIHLRRALIHVETCGSTGRAVLDSCGEEGDLFFLLDFLGKTVAYDLEALRLLLRGMCELLVRHEDATPLSLSKRELATMAAQSETGTDGV